MQQPILERQYYADSDEDDYVGTENTQIPFSMPTPMFVEGLENDLYQLQQQQQQQQMLLAQMAVAQQAQAQQAQAQEIATVLASIPEAVRKYIVFLHQTLLSSNPQDILAAYESGWNRTTEKYYRKSEWPEAESIAPLVNNDEVFLTMYRELYYRHVHSRLQPDIDDRFSSYENYCAFFNYVLNSETPVPLELPVQWLWDIIDEFIYQFASFTTWKGRPSKKSEEEIQMIAESPQVWSCYSVLNVLYSLMTKSKIQEQLAAMKAGEDPDEVGGEWGSRPLYRLLGYFSLIGLLRVHVLLGDYTLALKTLDDVELNKKAIFTRVNAAHVTVYYYVGFSYLMLRRYADAIKAFTHILHFLQRLKGYHTRGYQFEAITKQGDRMYALLAICQALCPTKIDDSIAGTMKEKYGEQYALMLRGGDEALTAFEDLFKFASPKYLSLTSPPYDRPELLTQFASAGSASPSENPSAHHTALFMAEVKGQMAAPAMRSFLRLYTTLGVAKLAGFMGVEEESVVEQLMVLKGSMRTVKKADGEGGLLDGREVLLGDLDFCLDNDIVEVAETKPGRRFNEYFIRHGNKLRDLVDSVHARALPTGALSGRSTGGVVGWAAEGEDSEPRGGDKKVTWSRSIK